MKYVELLHLLAYERDDCREVLSDLQIWIVRAFTLLEKNIGFLKYNKT